MSNYPDIEAILQQNAIHRARAGLANTREHSPMFESAKRKKQIASLRLQVAQAQDAEIKANLRETLAELEREK